jgi:hypothetical protein
LVGRVIAAQPDVVLLSETNPRSVALFSGLLNPVVQIRKWNPSLAPSVAEFDEHEIGYPARFGEMLERVHASAQSQGFRLIVRDYNYVDFVGVPFIWPVPMDVSLDLALAGRFEPVSTLLVRHPARQLASLWSHRAIGPVLSADRFLGACQAFLDVFRDVPWFRYEDLIGDPHNVFPRMLAILGVPWDSAALERFSSIENVTGNMRRKSDAAIREPKRTAAADRAHEELDRLPGYGELLGRLSYSVP